MAAEKEFKSVRTFSPESTANWPSLFEPRTPKNNPTAKPQYEIEQVFAEDADLTELKQAAAKAAKMEWPNRKLSDGIQFPFKSGDAMIEHENTVAGQRGKEPRDLSLYAGKTILRLKNSKAPRVLDKKLNDILDREAIYGGCKVRCEISFRAYQGNGSNIPDCVTAYVESVVKVGDGERLGGSRDMKAAWAGVLDTKSEEDVDLNEKIPF